MESVSPWFVEVVDTRATAQEGEEFLVDVWFRRAFFPAYFYVLLNFNVVHW